MGRRPTTEQNNARQARTVYTATIALGAAVSNTLVVPLGAKGLVITSQGDGWTAADLIVQLNDGSTEGNWVTLENAALKVASADIDGTKKQVYTLESPLLQAYTYLRLRSSDTVDGTAENQAAARVFQVKFTF